MSFSLNNGKLTYETFFFLSIISRRGDMNNESFTVGVWYLSVLDIDNATRAFALRFFYWAGKKVLLCRSTLYLRLIKRIAMVYRSTRTLFFSLITGARVSQILGISLMVFIICNMCNTMYACRALSMSNNYSIFAESGLIKISSFLIIIGCISNAILILISSVVVLRMQINL